MVDGESHYYLGRRYRLLTVAAKGAARVTLRNGRVLELHAPRTSTTPAESSCLSVHSIRREMARF
jgi:hypothetical protein